MVVRKNPKPSKVVNDLALSAVASLRIFAGTIQNANATALALFSGLPVVGHRFAEILRAAETAGILNIDDAKRITSFIDSGARRSFFEMRDGRSMMCSLSHVINTETLLEFIDVSDVFSLARSRQRDDLTDLCSRQELVRALAQRMNTNARDQAAILYIDLDRFKMINDTLGHPVGDTLLKLVAQRLTALLSPDDVLARLGGDEFAILQALGLQPISAFKLAEEIIEMVSRAYLINGQVIQISCSVGVGLLREDTLTAEDVIRNADIALLQAKNDGRGVIRSFTDEMHDRLAKKRLMEFDLRRALALQEFTLVYQPQFEIDGRKLIGFEALLRWNSEHRGHVSPGEFIPLAEELGLIAPLGEWVIRSACHEAARWTEPVTVAVNLSPLQFRNANLVSVVVSALASASLDPGRLELEITEGALLENTESVLHTLGQLKDLGVKISMDDFGTGYSSLGYLQRFPFDKIKIDKSFIRELATSPKSQAIVAAVIELGRGLGMTTIAEGVETKEQLAALLAIGCDEVQGFLTGRPMHCEDALSLVVSASPRRRVSLA